MLTVQLHLSETLHDVSMELSAPEDEDRRNTFERTLRGTGAFHLRFTLVHVSQHVSISNSLDGNTTAGCLLLVFLSLIHWFA